LPITHWRANRCENIRGTARELVVAPYRVIYVPNAEDVRVVTVKHSREKLRKKDLRPDLP
jgi:plasmid stabilization system protein ParE